MKNVNQDDMLEILSDKSNYIDRIIPPCNPNDNCNIIKDFIGEEDGSYDEYLRIKRDAIREICYQEDRIQELIVKLKEHQLIIKESKKEIDDAFEKYISKQWQ